MLKHFWSAAAIMLLSACGTSQVSSIAPSGNSAGAVRTLALDPAGGLVADAVGVQLAARGYSVVDTAQVSQLLLRNNMSEFQVAQPQALSFMASNGIDALLSVRASAAYDGQPEAASARITDTRNGALIAGATWQNGWGGEAGSIIDRTMRKGLNQAAGEIANALVPQLGK